MARKRGVKLGGNRGVKPTAKMRALSTAAIQQRADARAADIAIVRSLRLAERSLVLSPRQPCTSREK